MKNIFKKPGLYLAILVVVATTFCFWLLKQIAQNKGEIQNLQDQYAMLQSQIPTFYNIVSEWRPFIAHVACSFGNNDVSVGSGFLSKNPGSQVIIATSEHIVINSSGPVARACQFTLPDHTSIYTIANIRASAVQDFASLVVKNPDQTLEELATRASSHAACNRSTTAIGNWIVVLGYPVNGSPADITASTGIISGYDGNYYVTNAKIEHGSSGGVAILRKDDCYLGIPSYAESGDFDSFARILDFNSISSLQSTSQYNLN